MQFINDFIIEAEVEPSITHSEILAMGVAELRATLKRVGITIPAKALKADLQRLLKDSVKETSIFN